MQPDPFVQYILIVVSVVFVNNFVLAKFLGLCPFVGVSKKTDAAFGMGMAVCFVMTLASLVTYFIHRYVFTEPNVVGRLLGNASLIRHRSPDGSPGKRDRRVGGPGRRSRVPLYYPHCP